MEVYLDGKPMDGELVGGNLSEMLNDLMSNRLGDDRTIREVKVNGANFEEAVMGPAMTVGRTAIDRLDVDTLETREVAQHFLSRAHVFLEPIVYSVERVAELFRVGDEKDASTHYVRTLESLQLFMQTLQSTREALALDFEAAAVEGVSAQDRLNRLSGLVRELLEAQEQEDWVLLSDVLQYDLAPELSAWNPLLPELRRQVLA